VPGKDYYSDPEVSYKWDLLPYYAKISDPEDIVTKPFFFKLPLSEEDMAEELAIRKKEECLILTLEATPDAHSLLDFQLSHPVPKQVILVIGNEPAGVDPAH
jgi:hypothetical protein